MPLNPPRRRSPLHGAIVTATLPVITLAGISVAAAPAQAAPGPAGMAPTAKNIAASKARIAASLQASAAKKSASNTVTVKRGDSLWAIATRNEVPLAQLLKLNGLKASDVIHPGDRLVLRATSAASSSTKASAGTSKVTASSAKAASHTIKAGDTLSGIAHRYGLTLPNLLKLNGLKASAIIYPGQKLKLGATASASTSTSGSASSTSSAKKPGVSASTGTSAVKAAASHTIKAGDTLSGIAAKYSVSLNELLAANGLNRSSIIYVGRTLKLPATATSGTSGASSTGSIPKTFLQYTYSDATNRSANANKATLNARSVPSRAQMRQIVIAEAKRRGVDPALAVGHASVESGFDARAVSPANALGVMQMLPSTGEWISQRVGRKLDLLDPYDNVIAGVEYIKYLQSTARSFDEGIGAYYAGPSGVVKRGLKNDVLDYVNKVKAAMSA
ncbi:LysM peptidoglycan-binding domain-containing protein [Galactobacter valiniphilus]|uniref:LysM peptidoglycan-binding domain-containing protein n=1 Tax=Galactobacter valiniphilus TaxID=2676122 RepID=UPI00373550EA